jgi:hypothetical protein
LGEATEGVVGDVVGGLGAWGFAVGGWTPVVPVVPVAREGPGVGVAVAEEVD